MVQAATWTRRPAVAFDPRARAALASGVLERLRRIALAEWRPPARGADDPRLHRAPALRRVARRRPPEPGGHPRARLQRACVEHRRRRSARRRAAAGLARRDNDEPRARALLREIELEAHASRRSTAAAAASNRPATSTSAGTAALPWFEARHCAARGGRRARRCPFERRQEARHHLKPIRRAAPGRARPRPRLHHPIRPRRVPRRRSSATVCAAPSTTPERPPRAARTVRTTAATSSRLTGGSYSTKSP